MPPRRRATRWKAPSSSEEVEESEEELHSDASSGESLSDESSGSDHDPVVASPTRPKTRAKGTASVAARSKKRVGAEPLTRSKEPSRKTAARKSVDSDHDDDELPHSIGRRDAQKTSSVNLDENHPSSAPVAKRPRRPPSKSVQVADKRSEVAAAESPAALLEMSPKKRAALSCPYFQRIHRLDTSCIEEIRVPEHPPALLYSKMTPEQLRDRIKFICRRLAMSQTQLADYLGINHGNMSASLTGRYKFSSRIGFLYLLWQWAFQMDQKFVDEFKAHLVTQEALPDSQPDTIASAFSRIALLPTEIVQDYLSFALDPAARQPIDVAVLCYRNAENVLSNTRCERNANKRIEPIAGAAGVIAKQDLKTDAATDAVLASWSLSPPDLLPVPDAEFQQLFDPNYKRVDFEFDDQQISLQASCCFSGGESDLFVNAGGPITSLEWVATERLDVHLLMVCSQRALHTDPAIENPALIQMYEVTMSEKQPGVRFKLGVVVDHLGCIVSARFCPYKIPTETSTETVRRLGVLAVTGADGSLAIIALPDPGALPASSSVLRLTPVSRFVSSYYKIHSIAWHPTNDNGDMPIVLTGSHQGSVLLFDIRRSCQTPELVVPVARTFNDCVTNVLWCRTPSNLFIIGTHSGIIRLFNLRSPYVPLWSYDAYRPVYGIESIDNGYIVAFANGVRLLNLSSSSTNAPLFWLDLPLEGVTPTSLYKQHLVSSHVLFSITTDNGLAVLICIKDVFYSRRSRQERVVQVLSSAKPATCGRDKIRFAKTSTPSYRAVTLTKANRDQCEKLRQRIPQSGSSMLLLNPSMIMTRSSFLFSNPDRPLLFASGGYAGVVRLQILPPFELHN